MSLIPDHSYVLPSGYKVEMKVVENDGPWKLVGNGRGGLSLSQAVYSVRWRKIRNFKTFNGCNRLRSCFYSGLEGGYETCSRSQSTRITQIDFWIPRKEKSEIDLFWIPSVLLVQLLKLLTPSKSLYTEDFNEWLETIPQRVKDLVLIIKRRYRTEWDDDWEKYFSVDSVNGQPANELRFKGEKLITRLLRVGFDQNGSWRLFALRKDFVPAGKLLAEDDITVSTVAPRA